MTNVHTTVALLSVIAMPASAPISDPDGGTGNVLASGSTPTPPSKTAVRQSGLHSFAMVPRPGWSRVPRFDYRRGTSNYPFGPEYNFPYPDRPYGDPDHW